MPTDWEHPAGRSPTRLLGKPGGWEAVPSSDDARSSLGGQLVDEAHAPAGADVALLDPSPALPGRAERRLAGDVPKARTRLRLAQA